MKRIKLNVVSMAAMAAMGLTMLSCSNKGTASQEGSAADSAKAVVAATENVEYNGKIVFVQIDSIMSGYGLAQDLQASWEAKSTKAQNELSAKERSLQRELREYQEKLQKGLVTSFQAQEIEAGLQKKQQDLLAYRDRMMQELSEENNVMMNRISEAIMAYVRKYNAEKKFSMILSTPGANTVMTADPALNITDELLKGLNDEYRAQLDTMQNKKK